MGLHVALLGTGGWSRVHLAAFAASKDVDHVTIAGRNADAAQTLAEQFPDLSTAHSDIESACDAPTVDVVSICLPHHLHTDMSCRALAAGKHVICEKPAGTSLADFDRIAQTATDHEKRFLVVMNQLYNPLVLRARQLIDDGAIGRPFLCVETGFSKHAHFYRDANAWRTRIEQAGGGVLIDGGYHMIYKQLYLLAGVAKPRWVIADTSQLNVNHSGKLSPEIGEDCVSYTVGFDCPLRIVSSHAWTLEANIEHPRHGFIAGSEGTLELPVGADDPLVLRRDEKTETIADPGGPHTGPDTTHCCLLDYLEAITAGRTIENATVESARETLSVITSIYESSVQQKRVDI